VNEVLEIRVGDNGKGMPSPAQAQPPAPGVAGIERRRKGNGLANMRQRLASIGGSAAIESRTGQGTIVTFRLPLKSVSRK
jgi:signal transduction histidine kinase